MITLLLLLFLSAPQEPEQPVYSLDDLIITSYQPQHVDVDSLYILVSALLERNLQVEDRYVTNLNFIYDRILIYDTPDSSSRILGMMKQIDDGFQGGDAARLLQADQQLKKLSDFPVQEYRVRSMRTDSIFELLAPYQRYISAVDSTGNAVDFSNLNEVVDNVLLIRDSAENTAAMMGLLEKFDRPAPQVQISVWVLRGGALQDGPALPSELTKNLQQLIPDLPFHLDARGMLRSAMSPDLSLELALSGAEGADFTLSLRTGTFDNQSSSLALSECQLSMTTANRGEEQLFQTTTSVRAGEYAVIGVTGSEPVLLALRLQVLQ